MELGALGLPERSVNRVAELITTLDHHIAAAGDSDCAVLCDADLAMLAVEPQRYRAYLAEVRAEYAHLPVEVFVRARIKILRRLSERQNLYASPMGQVWEEAAHQNLDAELQRLEKELATLESPPGQAQADDAHDDAAGADPQQS
jgi:predicted metal-dependent HD superfamily phosphohydrolase